MFKILCMILVIFSGHADELTVIEDSQESQEIHTSSRSPSPEFPLLSHPSNPSHQPSFTPRQKMQDNVTLMNSPSANGSRVKDDGNAESDRVKKKKKKKNESAKHTDSEADLVWSDGSERKKKKKKKNRGDNDNKSTSDNAAESSDATISGVSESPQLPKKRKSSHSSPQKPSKENLTEAGAPPSQSQSEDGSNEQNKSRAKRKKRKREVKVLSSQDVPSSQTDQSEGEGALVIDCDDLMSETEDLGSTKSKSQGSGNTVEENNSQETEATASDSQQSCGEIKKLKKKKKRKNMSTLATAETASGEGGDEQTTAAQSATEPSVTAAKDADLTENEDLGEGTTTDTDVIDVSSETLSQSGKKKRKKKHKKKEAALPQPQVITKLTTRKKPPPSVEESGGKTSHEDDSATEEDDDVSRNGGSSSQEAARSKDGFLKPTAIPPSMVSPKVQLSPAAGITLSARVSPGKVKSGTPKESSLLSVFSVTG